jgi:hypothetical protein
MTTLTIMLDRIDRELRRGGTIDTQIREAVLSAIAAYSDDRFHFNEKRSVTFNTVANQEFYDSDDAADLANLVKIDHITMRVGNSIFDILPETPVWMEGASDNATATGQPGWYVYYERQLRLYPVPAESGWVVRVSGVYRYAAPATDEEANNFWMTEAERLIRCRAKYELATHVLIDTQLAQVMTANTTEAFSQLKKKTNKLTQHGNGKVHAMPF